MCSTIERGTASGGQGRVAVHVFPLRVRDTRSGILNVRVVICSWLSALKNGTDKAYTERYARNLAPPTLQYLGRITIKGVESVSCLPIIAAYPSQNCRIFTFPHQFFFIFHHINVGVRLVLQRRRELPNKSVTKH